jgi:acetyl-CoA decarbonylase/synthase complex subunit gamma
MVRWGIRRYTYTVDPGLYALGSPGDRSPVLATANYKLSFDALRRELAGRDAWLLALDTRGINVWCAAGKGTFGTDELVRMVEKADLAQVVAHGTLVLPQLGAPGVASLEVRRRTGFRVVYGPVRAADIPAFLDAGSRATPEMRTVTFTLRDRLVLVPIEAVGVLGVAAAILAAVSLVGGLGPGVFSAQRALAAAAPTAVVLAATVLSGALVTPLLLPWIPGRMFALKGAEVGLVTAAAVLLPLAGTSSPISLAAWALLIVAGSSYIAMNFTGASTFTSLSGVQKEMRASLPWQIAGVVLAAALWIVKGFLA